jgi:hypothetical protein
MPLHADLPEFRSPHDRESGSEQPADAVRLRSDFQRAFRLATTGEREADLTTLRAMVSAFVRQARARGDPPERVLSTLKRLAIDSDDALHRRLETPEQRAVRDVIFGWFLDEYYGSP